MEKLKNLFKLSASNKAMWITLAIGTVIIVATTASVLGISYSKKQSSLASTEAKSSQEEGDVVKQEDLTDTSNMTEEELQKLNEKELEEAKKKEEENKKNGETNKTSNSARDKYYIKVNYGAQIVDVYSKDKDGKYTNRIKTFVCSTGRLTPSRGVYRTPAKITWCHMIGDVWGHYCTQIVGSILFHSVPYLERNNHTLEYWEYDKLGRKASAGCIRMTTRDAKWLFDNIPTGTQVEFYSDSSQAYRRPSAQKISNAPANIRVWDPTDPDPNNPWRTYKPEEDKKPTTGNEEQPGNNEVEKPSTGNTEKPGNNEIEKPGTGNTEQPGNNETENPGTGNTEEPGNNETENPGTGNTEKPGNTETDKPSTGDSGSGSGSGDSGTGNTGNTGTNNPGTGNNDSGNSGGNTGSGNTGSSGSGNSGNSGNSGTGSAGEGQGTSTQTPSQDGANAPQE